MATNENSTPQPIPQSHRDLLERPLFMALATTLPDETPQVTPVWFSFEDGNIYLNTAVGRLKDKAIRENPYVAVMVYDPENPYRYIQVRGPIVEFDEQAGRAHINALAKRYMGVDKYPGPEDEQRVRYTLKPERVNVSG